MRTAARQRTLAGREAAFAEAEPLIPESADPAVATLQTERRAALLAALEKLSEEHRLVVTYRYLLEMDEVDRERIAAMGVCQSGAYPLLLNSIRHEVTANLGQLSQAIRAEASGQRGEWMPPPRTPLSRQLLAMIRGAFLDRVQSLPGADTPQLLRLLQAIEVVGRGLEADWSQHFADRLSAPDGLELVVEVAHDLRSPLTSILFLAETLQRGRSGPVSSTSCSR